MYNSNMRDERTIRALTMDNTGVHVGEPLRQLRGILSGVPVPQTERQPGSS